MDTPVPDPAKRLSQWHEWERSEVEPGRSLANLEAGGLPDLLAANLEAGGLPDLLAALAGDEVSDS